MKATETPFSPGNQVIAYLRDSGHENQELSISQQESEIREFCVKNGIILHRAYIDAERQGSSDKTRDKLAEMMHDLRRGLDVEGVLVWSNSRFARNSLHAQFYRAEIRKLGYKFHSLTGKSIEGPEAIIFEALEDYKNERFLTDLSIDVKRGLRTIVRDYGCVPGTAPTGFLRELVIIGKHRDGKERTGHRWLPDPLFVPRIQEAFTLRANGVSLGEINARTNLFTTINSFRTFFCNPIYKGTLKFGDDLVIENYCEAMIDEATWNAVQAVQNNFTRHRNLPGGGINHPRRVASKYLLSGIICCGRCGSPLFGRSHPQKNGTKTTSYYCSQAYNQRNCTKQRIPGALVETTVLEKLKNIWLDPKYLESVRAILVEKHSTFLQESQIKRAQAVAELAEIRRQITNMAKAIADKGHSNALLNLLTDLENQETKKLNKIAEIDREINAEKIPTFDPEQIKNIVTMLDVVFPKLNIQARRRILRGLVPRVDVDRDGRRIFGTMTVQYPPEDDPGLNDFAPIWKTDGGKNVRMISEASGPPRYTHIIEFQISITGLSGGYKNPSY